MKIGTKVPSISNFGKGAPTQSRSKGTVIDADTFWNTWDASERAPYLANQEFFEQIMTQKQAVLPG